MIELRFDTPPSVNAAFRNVPGKGRVKTTGYKKWIATAAAQVMAQKRQRIAGQVAVDIACERIQRSDIDNRIKATLDLLVRTNVIEDDRKVEEVRARWSDDIAGTHVKIWGAG